MLEITVPQKELWDEEKEEFAYQGQEQTLRLEHSLVSLSKWEAKYKKPFLSKKPKTMEEVRDYVRFMTVTQNVDPEVYRRLTPDNYREINAYIDDPMTATWFNEERKTTRGQQVTSELIYYWMIESGVPPEYQKWHLNRLLTLLKVCSVERQANKKKSKREVLSENAALNAARKARLRTKG